MLDKELIKLVSDTVKTGIPHFSCSNYVAEQIAITLFERGLLRSTETESKVTPKPVVRVRRQGKQIIVEQPPDITTDTASTPEQPPQPETDPA